MCPRAKKPKIQATPDSLNHLLQEIYNECVEIRKDAMLQRIKILKQVEELEDIQMVGKITNDLLKIIDLAIDKKLALAKLQAGLISAGGNMKPTDESNLTTDQMKFLRDTFKQIKQNQNVDIDLEQSNG